MDRLNDDRRAVAAEGEVTRLLAAWRSGANGAGDRLIPLVYRELRRLAARCMVGERSDHTLEPTALVHETYLRLAAGAQPDWRNRLHFFAVSARMMRHILVDHARSRRAAKRGGAVVRIPLEAVREPHGPVAEPREEGLADLLALDQALDALASLDRRKARVVELRYFGGLTVAETARVLGVSAPTVALDARMARAWLVSRLRAPTQGRAQDESPEDPASGCSDEVDAGGAAGAAN